MLQVNNPLLHILEPLFCESCHVAYQIKGKEVSEELKVHCYHLRIEMQILTLH